MMKTLKTKLHAYKFDTSVPEQGKAYRELKKQLKAQGCRLMSAWSGRDYEFHRDQIKPLDGKEVTLEIEFLFDNQWNTGPTETSETGIRVFDWYCHYPIERGTLRYGHYLEQTEEMKSIRENTLVCGWCGAMHPKDGAPIFCDKCLDGVHLEENRLNLLRLVPVSQKWGFEYPPLTDEEKTKLLPEYVKRQTTGNDSRNAQKLKRQRQEVENKCKSRQGNAQIERDGLIWLLDHEISIDNCIYYNHTGRFCFGWRTALGPEIKKALLEKLGSEFPFDYDIKETEESRLTQ